MTVTKTAVMLGVDALPCLLLKGTCVNLMTFGNGHLHTWITKSLKILNLMI